MTVDDRVQAMRDFCERHDFDMNVWRGSQREPGHGVAIRVSGVLVRAESQDSLQVAVARMELALQALGAARSDVYLHAPHGWMGRL